MVFYELLVGRRPFQGDSQEELLEQIDDFEPRPPRQYDDHIPKELERICLKALSKRASERYSTAKDMADDLRHFLAEQTSDQQAGHWRLLRSCSRHLRRFHQRRRSLDHAENADLGPPADQDRAERLAIV